MGACADLLQQGLHIGLRLGVARQHQPAAIQQWNPHLHHLNGGKLFQHRRRCQTGRLDHQPVLQRDLQAIGQEGDEHMGIGAVLKLVIDGPQTQCALQRTKYALNLRQLDVTGP